MTVSLERGHPHVSPFGVLSRINRIRPAQLRKPASDAGKILSNPNSTKKEKEVAASDLSQAKHKPKGK
jgi:hypothetical protein